MHCAELISQADAQAVLRVDPTDPNQVDTARPRPDGVSCESSRAARELVPVPGRPDLRTRRLPTRNRPMTAVR